MAGARTAPAQPDLQALATRFAKHPFYQAGTVAELTLEEGVFRRPQRGEDFELIDFDAALGVERFQSLRSLTFHRLLNAGYELLHRPPGNVSGLSLADAVDMVSGLDDLCFHPFDGDTARPWDPARDGGAVVAEMVGYWRRLFERLAGHDYVTEGTALVLTQFLAASVAYQDIRHDLRAGLSADFGQAQTRPALQYFERLLDNIANRARAVGLSPARHAHWQFYLAGGLAAGNAIYRASAAGDAAGCVGALIHADLLLRAFIQAQEPGPPGKDPGFGRWLPLLQSPGAPARIGRGFWFMDRLWRAARRDLAAQLDWLGRLGDFIAAGHQLGDRIARERPDIDRETFVEPREMVSTTHIHDDHRLVVVESGGMVMWGRAGMRCRLAPGDMLYVPRGRLHGSAVTTRECVYHQPILPDGWVKPLAPKSLETPEPAMV